MKLLVSMIFALGLSKSDPLKKTVYHNSSHNIVFPKDRKISARIIGGEIVSPYAYPFQVLLWICKESGDCTACGGSLISTSWVLTAAHCLEKNPNHVVIVLGDVVFTDTLTKPTTLMLVSDTFILHEDYYQTDVTVRNDIALVKLPRSAPISQYISTVAYANVYNNYENYSGIALGWGRTTSEIGGPKSYLLRKVISHILSNAQCHESLPTMTIGPDHLCLSGEGPAGVCKGDSGGPLLVNEIQVGITSFGTPDCSAGEPSVFTRVSYFSDWIQTNAVDGSESYRNLHRPIIISLLCYFLKHMYIRVIF